jgi:hypothetical protein
MSLVELSKGFTVEPWADFVEHVLTLHFRRPDVGILNITCDFAFTASGKASDAGKTSRVYARVQNTNATSTTEPAYRGWTGMTGDDSGGWIGLMVGYVNSTTTTDLTGANATSANAAGIVTSTTGTTDAAAAVATGEEPVVQTFANYNQARYFAPAAALMPPSQKVARLFPIVDEFSPDGDLNTKEGAYKMLTLMGINTPTGVFPPGWKGR